MSSAALRPEESRETPPEASRARPPRRLRLWLRLALIGGVIAGLLQWGGGIADEPLRRAMEGRMNRSLRGYRVRIAKLHLQPLGGAVTLHGVEIRQIANPEPPLAVIPALRASVEWRQVLFLRLVADFTVESPNVYMNLMQLRGEASNAVPVRQRGWQEAVEAIYPLKINLLRIDDATVVYVDEDPQRPMRLTHLNARVSNIRNIHSRQRAYPSALEAEAVLFGSGHGSLVGHADFLAEPHLGIQGELRLADIPLDDLRPIGSHWNVEARKGVVSAFGEVEYAPTVRRVHVTSLVARGVRVDYVHHARARAAKPLVAASDRKATDSATGQRWDVTVDRLRLLDADLGFTNEARTPKYRVFLDRTQVDVSGVSSVSSARPGIAVLNGRFMGSGAASARATFRPTSGRLDLSMRCAVEGTDMRQMNDLFRAHGKFDVAAGSFSLFSEVRMHEGAIDGYVKPLFPNVEVCDSRQEAGKGLLRKVYESAVDAAAKVLTNRKRNEVATSVTLHGPADDPRVSTLQALAGFVENAFFKAILPGFDQQVGVRPR